MEWARMLAYITGTVYQDLLLRNKYLATENRILRRIGKTKGRIAVEPEYWLRDLGSVSWWGFDRE